MTGALVARFINQIYSRAIQLNNFALLHKPYRSPQLTEKEDF